MEVSIKWNLVMGKNNKSDEKEKKKKTSVKSEKLKLQKS